MTLKESENMVQGSKTRIILDARDAERINPLGQPCFLHKKSVKNA